MEIVTSGKGKEEERAHKIALTFVMAPLPNSICSRCGNAGDYSETNSAYIDFGRFLTGMFVVCFFPSSYLDPHNILLEEHIIRAND
jgi:hypothetical protein